MARWQSDSSWDPQSIYTGDSCHTCPWSPLSPWLAPLQAVLQGRISSDEHLSLAPYQVDFQQVPEDIGISPALQRSEVFAHQWVRAVPPSKILLTDLVTDTARNYCPEIPIPLWWEKSRYGLILRRWVCSWKGVLSKFVNNVVMYLPHIHENLGLMTSISQEWQPTPVVLAIRGWVDWKFKVICGLSLKETEQSLQMLYC